MTSFLLKILIVSTLLSIVIKYGGTYLPITGNTPTVLIAILSPSLILAALFALRWQQSGTRG